MIANVLAASTFLAVLSFPLFRFTKRHDVRGVLYGVVFVGSLATLMVSSAVGAATLMYAVALRLTN